MHASTIDVNVDLTAEVEYEVDRGSSDFFDRRSECWQPGDGTEVTIKAVNVELNGSVVNIKDMLSAYELRNIESHLLDVEVGA